MRKEQKGKEQHYHSTTSRRDFMKALGLGASAVVSASAGLSSNGFADMDEMLSSPLAETNHAWWVKEVDKPTVEVDWDRIERFDGRKIIFLTALKHFGTKRFKEVYAHGRKDMIEGMRNKTPGKTVRDRALLEATSFGWREHMPSWTGEDQMALGYTPMMTNYTTPEELGVPRWEGTPEENSRMVRVALRLFGASEAGFVKLTKKNKKLIYTYEPFGRKIVFEDVDRGYATRTKKVLPNKDLWMIVYTIPQSLILTKAGEFGGFGGAVPYAYVRSNYVASRLMVFLRTLGYQRYGGDSAAVGPSVAWGVLAGLGEYSRAHHVVSPKYGNAIRTTMLQLTDLPLAETRPIDAGILKFCMSCKKCATMCPSGAISTADEPSWETKGDFNSPGIKGFYLDGLRCWEQMFMYSPPCTRCQAVCPYSKMDKAAMHSIIRATVGTTSVVNPIIRDLADVFGYGVHPDTESIWDTDPEEIPLDGLDPSRS
jgi:reductive dehalogenase